MPPLAVGCQLSILRCVLPRHAAHRQRAEGQPSLCRLHRAAPFGPFKNSKQGKTTQTGLGTGRATAWDGYGSCCSAGVGTAQCSGTSCHVRTVLCPVIEHGIQRLRQHQAAGGVQRGGAVSRAPPKRALQAGRQLEIVLRR